jgi:CRP-like cAMP-binding protein
MVGLNNLSDSWLGTPLFAGLTSLDLNVFFTETLWKQKTFEPGENVIHQGDEIEFQFMLWSGRTEAFIVGANGKGLALETLQAPQTLAPALTFSDCALELGIRCVERSTVWYCRKDNFLKLLMENFRLMANFLTLCGNRFAHLNRKLSFLRFKTLRAKCAYYVLSQSGEAIRWRIPIKLNELADYLGVERPSLSRTLAEIACCGAFERRGRNISAINRKILLYLTDI